MSLHQSGSPQQLRRAMPTAVPKANLPEIRRALGLMLVPGQVAELRVLNTRRGTVSGYFNDFEKLAQAAATWSGRAPGIYVTLNPVNPDLLARAANRVKEYSQKTTADTHILARRWLPADFDAVRPAGISSRDAEHEGALARAVECRDWLTVQGWPAPIYGDSGNGAHLLWRVDLPHDGDTTNLLMNCLKALSFRFHNEAVAVDEGNFNAARIWKLYGTLVAKGDSIPERPHRISRILVSPERLEPVPLVLLKALAAKVPQPPPTAAYRPYRGTGEAFDLGMWLHQHQIPIRYIGPWNGGQKYVLERCLWNPEHTDKSAFIVRFSNGGIAAGCHHNSCQGLGWRELREAVEPGYREQQHSPNGAVQWLAGQWVRRL